MLQIKYSVIIPVYNAQNTLKRCLESLLMQKRQDVEIILINDGSTDKSGEIIEDYSKKYSNIISLSQKNRGVSAARNRGLEFARGIFIMFVDSDDYVTANYFEVMDKADGGGNSDLLVCAKDVADKGINESFVYKKMCSLHSLQEKREILLNSRIIFQPPYKRFKKELIEQKKLRFIENMYVGEDFNFCFAYMLECQSISIKYEKIYIIDVSNTESLSRKYRADIGRLLQWEIEEASKSAQNSNLDPEEKGQLLSILDYFFVRNIFTCISEKFKIEKPSYWKNRKEYKRMCTEYSVRFCKNNKYYSGVHFLLRMLISRRIVFPLYIATVLVKGKIFRKNRTTSDFQTNK